MRSTGSNHSTRYRACVVRPAELRPLRFGETLDAAARLYRARFGPLVRLVAPVVVPLQVLAWTVTVSTTATEAERNADLGAVDWTSLAGSLVTSALAGLTAVLATVVATPVVTGAYTGGHEDARSALRALGSRWGAVVAVIVLATLGVALGTVALVLPGIYLAVAWCVSLPALVVERPSRGTQALRRSWQLVRGRWWPTLWTLLLAYLLTSMVTLALSLPLLPLVFSDVPDNVALYAAATTAAQAVALVATVPFLVAVVGVVYFDLRVRKEGLDIHLMARALPAPTAGAPDVAAPRAPRAPAAAPPDAPSPRPSR